MATLNPFIGQTSGPLEICLLSQDVGSGTVTSQTDFEIAFSGSFSIFGESGSITFSIALTDQNPDTTSGPCTITVNGNTDANASYSVVDDELNITTSLQPGTTLLVYQDDNGTEIEDVVIPGHNPHDVWIGTEWFLRKGKDTCERKAKRSKKQPAAY